MKSKKILVPTLMLGLTPFLGACSASTYTAEYNYDMEVEQFFDDFEKMVELFNEYDIVGFEVEEIDTSDFEEKKDGLYVLENGKITYKVYTKKDKVSRFEISGKGAKDDNEAEEISESLITHFVIGDLLLNPEMVYDLDLFEDRMDDLGNFAEEASEGNTFKSIKKFDENNSDYTYDSSMFGTKVTLAVNANDDDDYEDETYDQYLAQAEAMGIEGTYEMFEFSAKVQSLGSDLSQLESLLEDYEVDMESTENSTDGNQSNNASNIFEEEKDEVVVEEQEKEEVKEEKPSMNSSTGSATITSPSNPAKIGQSAVVDFKNLKTSSMVKGEIKIVNVVRGDKALKIVEEYNAGGNTLTIDTSDIQDGTELMVFEYELTSPKTDDAKDYYSSVSFDLTAMDGESTLEANGYSFWSSPRTITDSDDYEILEGAGHTVRHRMVVLVPENYDDFLLVADYYDGEQAAYLSVK